MTKEINTLAVWAAILIAAVIGATQPCSAKEKAKAKAAAEEDDYRVVSMGADAAEKKPAGAKAGSGDAGDWESIVNANSHNKLTGNERQIAKAEAAEDFDTDTLDRELLFDWYGASEHCGGRGGLLPYSALLKAWEAECRESTSTACSAPYWTSNKKDEQALAVNFLNGHVVQKDLDAFAYARCASGKTGGKPAAGRAAGKAAGKKGGDASAKIVDFILNYQPAADGPRLKDKLLVAITGAGASYGALEWTVKKKNAAQYSAAAVVPGDEGEIKFTFSVNYQKKTLAPVDARAKALISSITDPDVADGDMR